MTIQQKLKLELIHTNLVEYICVLNQLIDELENKKDVEILRDIESRMSLPVNQIGDYLIKTRAKINP